MTAICIIDTSVFCNILAVPNRSQQHKQTLEDLRDYLESGTMLPMATIYETGNHIAQNGDGRIRREKAQLFTDQVLKAFNGNAPWKPTPMDDLGGFTDWLNEFPQWAMEGSGFGDLSILKVFERQCELHPSRDIFIWSYDEHLSGYSRNAVL